MRAALGKMIVLVLLAVASCSNPARHIHDYRATVSTILSSANPLYVGGAGVAAAADGSVYAANSGKNNILKISPSGQVSVFAGSPAGTSGNTSSLLSDPFGIAIDNSNGDVYVSEFGFHDIRKIAPNGYITTLAGNFGVSGHADSTGVNASFNNPTGLAVDSQHRVYVADFSNHTIRRIDPNGQVTSIAGDNASQNWGYADGPGASALFNQPSQVSLDSAGNLYVVDHGGNYVRKISNGAPFTVSTVAGTGVGAWADGPALQAQFNSPSGVAVGDDGRIYVANWQDYTVRQITPGGTVWTIAGKNGLNSAMVDGTGRLARFMGPYGLSFANGALYIADSGGVAIRKLIPGELPPF